jgi:quinol monooxygenase YgiN
MSVELALPNEPENVCVIARAVAKPGREQELRNLLSGMLSPARAEEGCNFYRLFEDRESGRFYFYELWTSETALLRHAASVHFKQMENKLKDVLREPFEISLVEEIGAE